MSLVSRFKQTLADHADHVAVIHNEREYTYREVGQLAANVADYLRRENLSRGDRVALLLPNSFEYIGVFYGIWAAGGVTVALNTQAKAKDIINWVRHAEAKWLFIDGRHTEFASLTDLVDTELTLIPVDIGTQPDEKEDGRIWSLIANAFASFQEPDTRDTDLASIIYTSGTTGQPKGVTLSHGNLKANTESILQYLKLSKNDSIVNVLPFYYSYGNSVLHTHIAIGGRLILENSLLYPHQVIARIQEQRATGFSGVPSTFSLILGRVKLEEFELDCLRYITQAGGPMAPALTDKILRALPDIDLFIMYGQTEATARLTYLPSEKIIEKRGSIGIPIPGVTIHIRDSDGKLTAPGVIGEICARGPNIMQGYWKAPLKTKEVLIDGWLHTGDLAHYDDDGYIYINGRSSDMIKTGGNRISPKEVEEVIQEVDGVQEVAVVGISDELLGEVIKAYVVPTGSAHIDSKTIQRYCRENLALYKIPKMIELIDTLPKTASGKVQRFVLQDMHKPTTCIENNNKASP